MDLRDDTIYQHSINLFPKITNNMSLFLYIQENCEKIKMYMTLRPLTPTLAPVLVEVGSTPGYTLSIPP